MNGKEKCDFLRAFRKKIADDNGIVLEQKDCTHEGDCLGTCPMCDAESSYLMNELRKKDVIHLKADGKICIESGELKLEDYSRIMDQMDAIPVTDDEPAAYLGDVTPGCIVSDPNLSPFDMDSEEIVSNEKGSMDGWD